MVTVVRGSDVGPTALTRTDTVVALADGASKASATVARTIFFTEPPLSTRAYGPVGRRRSPGFRAYRAAPSRLVTSQWHVRSASPVTVAGAPPGPPPLPPPPPPPRRRA